MKLRKYLDRKQKTTKEDSTVPYYILFKLLSHNRAYTGKNQPIKTDSPFNRGVTT